MLRLPARSLCATAHWVSASALRSSHTTASGRKAAQRAQLVRPSNDGAIRHVMGYCSARRRGGGSTG
eukprot:6806959-Prymnesium_polylepis.1